MAMRRAKTAGRSLAVAAGLAVAGCGFTDRYLHPSVPATTDGMILRTSAEAAAPVPTHPDLVAAHDLYRDAKFSAAQSKFHKLAENTKLPPQVAEEARFYEAESLFHQNRYPKACDTYHKLLLDFPNSAYRDQAVKRMFDIADFWLEDTRAEMAARREKAEGKRLIVVTPIAHFDKKKPILDQEGRALQALENVHLNDITGPLAPRALFLAGMVKFYREDYKDADHYFTQIVEQHPNSPQAPQAIELAILAKHMSTGGPDYDGRKVAEARMLVDTALRAYPELAHEKSQFLEKQLAGINKQQAEKDFKIAEFYRRTNHPGSAYYYYEIVRRRYPGSPLAGQATEQMMAIRRDVESGKLNPDSSGLTAIWKQLDRMWAATPNVGIVTEPKRTGEDAPALLEAPRPLPPGFGEDQP